MVRFLFGIFIVLACTSVAQAEGDNLTGTMLREQVVGRTILVSTPIGPMPISYRRNGTMSGRAVNFIHAGFSGAKRDSGTWWISANRLCQKWSVWDKGRSFCYRMRKVGKVVHWHRNDGRKGTAQIMR